MAMNCEALVFGASIGIMNATLTANAEAMRHEIGTPSGLMCDCEKVLRATAQIRISSNSMPASNNLPVSVAAEDFGTISGVAMCTAREVSYSRDAFVQDNATYDLILSEHLCANLVPTTGASPQSCPNGWSTKEYLVNGTYSETIEYMRNEVREGTGDPGNPLLKINMLVKLRKRINCNATFEKNPLDVGALQIIEGTAATWQKLAGCRATLTLESADGSRSNAATGIITSCEMTKNREGWATWAVTVESQMCGEGTN